MVMFQTPTENVEELCIRYTDINRAVQQAKFESDYLKPSDLNSLSPEPSIINPTAELALSVTKLLAQK